MRPAEIIHEPMRVVIDPAVFVAGMRSRRGASHRVLRMLGDVRFRAQLAVPLLLESENVLRKNAVLLRLVERDIACLMDYLCLVSEHCSLDAAWRPAVPDLSMDLVLQLAVSSGAQYLVTPTPRDFPVHKFKGLDAVTPKQFLTVLRAVYDHYQPSITRLTA